MTILYRDFNGFPIPQAVDGSGNATPRAIGDASGVDFRQTKLLRSFLGFPIPNQIFDVAANEWVIDTSGDGGGGGGGGTNDYNQLINKPFIPSKTSDLTNDSNFITQQNLDSQKNIANGIAGLDANGFVLSSLLPPETKELRVVDDLSERDALQAFEGLTAYVKDATPDVTIGGALYIYDGSNWFKTANDGDFSATQDWDNIINKPSEFYVLPTASTNTLGGVRVDGTTIETDANGIIRVISGGSVESVNGKLGAVIINASDVGAASNNDLQTTNNNLTTLNNTFNEHLAQIIGQPLKATRDISLVGEQIIEGFISKPKVLIINANLRDNNSFSMGSFSENSTNCIVKLNNGVSTSFEDSAIAVGQDDARFAKASVIINNDNTISLYWTHVTLSDAPSGFLDISITAFYHGEV